MFKLNRENVNAIINVNTASLPFSFEQVKPKNFKARLKNKALS